MASTAARFWLDVNVDAANILVTNRITAVFPSAKTVEDVLRSLGGGRTGYTEVFSSDTTWTVPAKVTSIDILCGQGGSGGGFASSGAYNLPRTGGGGGGGGALSMTEKITVTPGETLTITVGARGTGGYWTSGTSPTTSGRAAGVGGVSLVQRGATTLATSATGNLLSGGGGGGGGTTGPGGSGRDGYVPIAFGYSTPISAGGNGGGGAYSGSYAGGNNYGGGAGGHAGGSCSTGGDATTYCSGGGGAGGGSDDWSGVKNNNRGGRGNTGVVLIRYAIMNG